jgi:putative membrane protein
MLKHRFLILTVAALCAFACAKEEPAATDTVTSTTETSGASEQTSTLTGTGATGGTTSNLTAEERDFIIKVAQGGMAEVATGQIASQQATNAEVKAFGQQMVTDHGKANNELSQLATNKGIAVPTETDDEHKKKADELAKKTGKDFDRAYVAEMVEDHKKDVAEFEKMSQSATDADLKTWTTNTLPTLRHHLEMIQALQAKMK